MARPMIRVTAETACQKSRGTVGISIASRSIMIASSLSISFSRSAYSNSSPDNWASRSSTSSSLSLGSQLLDLKVRWLEHGDEGHGAGGGVRPRPEVEKQVRHSLNLIPILSNHLLII